jgi:hypothetical protein
MTEPFAPEAPKKEKIQRSERLKEEKIQRLAALTGESEDSCASALANERWNVAKALRLLRLARKPNAPAYQSIAIAVKEGREAK